MTEYNDRESSREKDLVDIVVLAVTQDVDGAALALAITTEVRLRKMGRSITSSSPTVGVGAMRGWPSRCPTAPTSAPSTSLVSSSPYSSTQCWQARRRGALGPRAIALGSSPFAPPCFHKVV